MAVLALLAGATEVGSMAGSWVNRFLERRVGRKVRDGGRVVAIDREPYRRKLVTPLDDFHVKSVEKKL